MEPNPNVSSNKSSSQVELLHDELEDRFVIFPIKYNDIWAYYEQAKESFWVPSEIILSKDLPDWNNTLNNDERNFISMVLAFFAVSDGIVMKNLAENFIKEITVPEVKFFYGFQIAIENIHAEMYSILLDTYITDNQLKNHYLNAVETIPSIKLKADWVLKWLSPDYSFATRLIAFAIVECIFFSSSFAAIFWLKKRSLMQGLASSNEFISRDEGLHVKFACYLYTIYVKNKLPNINDMIKEAVNIEKAFVNDMLPVPLIGMNNILMCEYVEYMGDILLTQLKYDKIFNTLNPFDFMINISLEGKTNFFEKKVSEYKKMPSISESDFIINEEF